MRRITEQSSWASMFLSRYFKSVRHVQHYPVNPWMLLSRKLPPSMPGSFSPFTVCFPLTSIYGSVDTKRLEAGLVNSVHTVIACRPAPQASGGWLTSHPKPQTSQTLPKSSSQGLYQEQKDHCWGVSVSWDLTITCGVPVFDSVLADSLEAVWSDRKPFRQLRIPSHHCSSCSLAHPVLPRPIT